MKCIGLIPCPLNFFYVHKNITFEMNKLAKYRY
jgi:hypothetical protein